MSLWYETTFRRVLFPAYESGLRHRDTLSWLDRYEHDQWLSPEQMAQLQWTRLKQLLEHCHREVPYYQKQWRELGVTPSDIRTMDDFARLPLLTKADIRANLDDLKAVSLRDQLLYKATGGSTGEPMRFGYTRESNNRRHAVMWRGYGWAGAPLGARSLLLWGAGVGNPPWRQRVKDHLYHAAFSRRVINSFHMTEANMAEFADAIDAFRPRVLLGYTGPLIRLAQWMLDTGRHVYRPQSFISCGEALHEFQREIIEKAFGCPAFNTYGCREFMLVASECERHEGLHVNSDHLLVELPKTPDAPPDGETGEVVVTDLSNYGMPFIRYATTDLATPAHHTCSCGRGLPLIKQVDGRVLDAIHTPDGRVLPGMFFPFLFKETKGVSRYQVVQRQLDRLDISIVRGAEFNDDSLAFIRNEIYKVLGDSLQLHCHFVDTIPLTSSGKTRLTISELANHITH
ncbi:MULTISPECIES: phenylacetate--CoA ligase family protein [unclassified Dyella]|uniref:phenylacetate--CoA ligase family protein n=1 Tax=unclassified Dyella TaxID=2634549 RepID=UPI000CC96D8F|nr:MULTISPECIES: phenylacetate--CoA ligase family protein [unclassified Dyella]MDR3447740.1 phenylacetate--CoA ligase family protein [Dyella sp.]PMQ05402.1 Phenylacetate-coenzyme A ligase [Dyella sp. AD56]